MKRILRASEKRFPIAAFIFRHLIEYKVPASLNFWYAFGLLALIFVFNQFISGLWLVMFYVPTIQEAFSSIQMLMHQVPSGWFIRYLHTTGASFLFIVLYFHMFRGFLYGSYRSPREVVWGLGWVLWISMMIEAFMGYVLPWGQMSYWGAEVMTSFLSAIPWLGPSLTYWLKGGSILGQPLLQRFFAFHCIAIPFFIFIIIKFHIVAIRYVGSSEPIQEKKVTVKIPFFPDHLIKEAFPISIMITLFFLCIFFIPNGNGLLIESGNQVPANIMQTPSIIHPPWYIAPFFTILRAVPNLTAGLFLTLLSLFLWLLMPVLDRSTERLLRSKSRTYQALFIGFMISFIVLGILGFYEINNFNLILARIFTGYYFLFFLLMPWYSKC